MPETGKPAPKSAFRVVTLAANARGIQAGLRFEDGLRLEWPQIDIRRRLLSKSSSKNGKVVHIRLSDYAIELFSQVTRVISCPYVFVRIGENKPIKKAGARGALGRTREKLKLGWVGFDDFRHFRGSQWVMRNVDLRTVQQYLGQKDIHTTMRYYAQTPDMCSRRSNLLNAR